MSPILSILKRDTEGTSIRSSPAHYVKTDYSVYTCISYHKDLYFLHIQLLVRRRRIEFIPDLNAVDTDDSIQWWRKKDRTYPDLDIVGRI